MSKVLGKRKNQASAASNGGPVAQFKKPRFFKKKESVKAMVRAAIRQVAEKKFFDTSITNQSGTTAAQIDMLNTIGGGATEILRDGNVAEWVSIGYKFAAKNVAADTQGNAIRLILFIDHQSNGAAPSATTLLQSDTFLSYMNVDNADRFTILDDRIVHVPAENGPSGTIVPNVFTTNVWKKLKDCKSTYASDSAVVPNTNSIGLLQIAQNAGSNYAFEARGRFIDA